MGWEEKNGHQRKGVFQEIDSYHRNWNVSESKTQSGPSSWQCNTGKCVSYSKLIIEIDHWDFRIDPLMS